MGDPLLGLTLVLSVGTGLLVPVLLFVLLGLVAWILFGFVVPLKRLTEETRLLNRSNPGHRIQPSGARSLRTLTKAVAEVGERLARTEEDLRARIDDAQAAQALDRETLAAVMAEVSEGVLVCTSEGQILLYNAPAQRMLTDGDEGYVGLGRSLLTLIDRHVVTFALDELRARIARSLDRPVVHVSSSVGARLLRLRVTPMLRDESELAGLIFVMRDVAPPRAPASQDRTAEIGLREPMLGQDVLLALQRQAKRHLDAPVALDRHVGETVWVEVDAFAVVQVFISLLAEVRAATAAETFTLRTGLDGARVMLDLTWSGPRLDADVLQRWKHAPVTSLFVSTPHDVTDQHGAEVLLGGTGDEAYVRFLLPRYNPEYASVEPSPTVESRPVYFDTALLTRAAPDPDIECRPLRTLTCTVFDTETTGLDPSGGDEIISIGAVRVVHGRIAPGEAFDELVDPRRPLSLQSIQIHGIEPEQLRGRPVITDVLPRFHRFVGESVLAAHNAAFDLRFLQLKESAAGVRFDGPVLDTLLLSALAFPSQSDHGLDALAARLGVEVTGRHTALGDALVTAEVFLKLVPLLEAEEIITFGDARQASEKTALARLRY